MNTFLPFYSFEESAKVLDRARLGKQRVECLQILNTLSSPASIGWKNHPAVKMWKGYEGTLAGYGIRICEEWIRRGYKDSCLEKLVNYLKRYSSNISEPFWLNNESFHSSHRAALLFKNHPHYSQFGWKEEPKLNYVWPI